MIEKDIYIGYHNVKKIEILECKKKIGIFQLNRLNYCCIRSVLGYYC